MKKVDDLAQLDSQIAQAKERIEKADKPKQQGIGATRGATELVAGVMVGSFVGYHIDVYFGTLPIFFIICFFFGVAGGAFSLYKLAANK